MEVLASAVLGDVISRSISFVIDRYYQLQAGAVEENLQRLRRALLRVQATVEEAERRHITNQAMLQQLEMLRQGMYRGYYVLDTFKCRSPGYDEAKVEDKVSDHSFALSRFNPAKRLCLSTRTSSVVFDGKEVKELRKMLGSLDMIIANMEEFVVFLKCYPPMCREPFSRYLFSDKCMFGRHAEYERIVNFLLQVGPPGTGNLSVLPIIGPARVGKSTLVEHVCYDERVRDYFSSIVFFSGDDLEGAKVNASVGSHMAQGSKIIITSRSEKIQHFGTAQALMLKFLPREAYWYFFKMIALRTADPVEYPTLSSTAMEIAAELNASFNAANIIGTLLRDNLDIQFWRKVLRCWREFNAKHFLMFGEHPIELMQKDRPIYLWRMVSTSEALLAYRCYQICTPLQEVPNVTMQDVVSGRVRLRGKFDVLAWKSHIPPYYSYLISCGMVKKKRSRLQGI